MLNIAHFRTLVVRPMLERLNLNNLPVLEELIVGTALKESNLVHLKQIGGGPAIGIMQHEPATIKDIVLRYLVSKPALEHKFWLAVDNVDYEDSCPHEDLEWLVQRVTGDLGFSVALARMKYYMIPEKLPNFGDVEGYAQYWSKYYNTRNDKREEEKFVNLYKRFGQ